MIKGIYAVHDARVKAFNDCFMLPHEDLAKRGFVHEVNRKGSDLGAHFRDYSLWKLGDFDDQTGTIVPCQVLLFLGVEVKVPERSDNLDLEV